MKQSIIERYSQEAACCSNLSCGGALEKAAPAPGEIVVDLGSGRGMDVIKAARLVGPQGHAYGIDFTPDMVSQAEVNRQKLNIINASFLQDQIFAVDLPEKSVDVVISNCVINHAPDKGAVFAEIFRLLKTGGRMVVSDIIAVQPLPPEVRNDPEAWAGCYGGAITAEEYLEAVQGAGFNSIEILEKSAPYLKGGVEVMSLTLKGIKTATANREHASQSPKSCCQP